jgi:DNA-directed RNA polymerase specialized sigma24 family protein
VHAQQFDAYALGQVHDHYYPQLYRYLSFRLSDPHHCVEIAGLVFKRLAETFKKQYLPLVGFERLLFEQADLLASDRLRQEDAQNQAGPQADPPADPAAGTDEMGWLAGLARRAVQALTFEEQHILALRFAVERSLDEIALLTGRNIADLRLIQYSSLASLRSSLEKES